MDIQEEFARQAIELARQARLAGNHPFGALLVVDGKVTLTAQNTVSTVRRGDATRKWKPLKMSRALHVQVQLCHQRRGVGVERVIAVVHDVHIPMRARQQVRSEPEAAQI
jgi:hypothetical protein